MALAHAHEPLPDFDPPGVPPPEERDPDGPWRITDDGAAEWVMRKLARAERELRALSERRQEWLQQIEDWHTQAAHPHERTVEWAATMLQRYAVDRREADPDAKSLVLPSGELRTRTVPQRVQVIDPGQVAASLARAVLQGVADPEVYDDLVRTELRVNAAKLQQLVEWTPEGVPVLRAEDVQLELEGVSVEPEKLAVSVRPR